MLRLVAWLLLLVVSWPLALLALVAWPFVWLVSLLFRLVGVSVGAAFDAVEAIINLPARLVGGPHRRIAHSDDVNEFRRLSVENGLLS